MSISRDVVIDLARLARLEPGPEEIDGLARDLAEVLDYAQRLPARAGFPEQEPEPGGTPLRDDRAELWLAAGAATAPAPDREGDLFRVPPVPGRE